ncbi:MAG: sulfatase [Pseudomonadales bacterium]|nr:sulfatase [Pseudomonadales bacterium]
MRTLTALMRNALLSIFLLGSGPLCALPAKPNFVLIILDDWGWEDSGAYGNRLIRTPHINQLAENGMRFDNAFLTTSSCTASRASILTGQYPHNSGALRLGDVLPMTKKLFPEYLREAGYFTAGAGKWHLGPESGSKLDVFEHLKQDDAAGTENWLKVLQQRPADKPFFILLAAMDPHLPHDALPKGQGHRFSDVKLPPYWPDTRVVRQALVPYYDEISRADGYIGQVLDELARQGVAENTVVLLMSDNGAPFPRSKLTLFDSGIKTPLIVRWPEVIKAAAVAPDLVSSVDIAPTLLDLAGLPVPAELPGHSFREILLGQKNSKPNRYIFAEQNTHAHLKIRKRAVRDARFLYIRNDLPETAVCSLGQMTSEMAKLYHEGALDKSQAWCFSPVPEEELFDVEKDPYSLWNLSEDEQYRQQLAFYRTVLHQWQRDTHDWYDSCLQGLLPCVSRYE